MTDEQLVTLSQEGDIRAFNRLASRVESGLFRFTLRTVGNPQDARDVCQEALLRAYSNISGLRDGRKFQAWVHHIALNLCRDLFRSQGYRAETQALEAEKLDEAGAPPLLERGRAGVAPDEKVQLTRMLERAFDRLPPEQRSAILLREYQGFTSEEIGEITGVPAATVRTRIFYGLRSLRRMLQEEAPSAG